MYPSYGIATHRGVALLQHFNFGCTCCQHSMPGLRIVVLPFSSISTLAAHAANIPCQGSVLDIKEGHLQLHKLGVLPCFTFHAAPHRCKVWQCVGRRIHMPHSLYGQVGLSMCKLPRGGLCAGYVPRTCRSGVCTFWCSTRCSSLAPASLQPAMVHLAVQQSSIVHVSKRQTLQRNFLWEPKSRHDLQIKDSSSACFWTSPSPMHGIYIQSTKSLSAVGCVLTNPNDRT